MYFQMLKLGIRFILSTYFADIYTIYVGSVYGGMK